MSSGNRRPDRPRFESAIALDEEILFIPAFILDTLPFVLISNTRLFTMTTVGYAITELVSSTIHILYPNQVQRRTSASRESLSWSLIAWYQSLCKLYGNFPGTHVAFTVLTVSAGSIVGGPLMEIIFLVWAVLIALSTLTARQHYLLDVLAGAAIGAVAAVLIYLTL